MHQIPDFGTWGELNFLTCADKNGYYDNILQPKYLNRIKEFNRVLMKDTVLKLNDKNITFQDICAKQNGHCLIDGLGLLEPGFYDMQLTDFMKKKELKAKEKQYLDEYDEFDEYDEDQNERNDYRFYIAGFILTDLTYNLGKTFRVNSFNESKNGTEPGYSRYLKLRYNLQTNSKHTRAEVLLWEQIFLNNTRNMVDTDNNFKCETPESMRVSYGVSGSIDTELEANIELDTIMVSATFMIIIMVATALMSLNATWVTAPGALLPFAGKLNLHVYMYICTVKDREQKSLFI